MKTESAIENEQPMVWARREGTYMGMELDRGQVVPKLGSPKDARLKELGYLPDYEPTGAEGTCLDCGAQFVNESFLRAHDVKRHGTPVSAG